MNATVVGYLFLALAVAGVAGGSIHLYQARTGREVIKTRGDMTPEQRRRFSLQAGALLLFSAVAEAAFGIYMLS